MNYASWGCEIQITIIGVWGHNAYSENYTFSGAKGHYPNTTYRFTRFGNSSIAKDRYSDIEIHESNFQVGYGNSMFKIDKIKHRKDEVNHDPEA